MLLLLNLFKNTKVIIGASVIILFLIMYGTIKHKNNVIKDIKEKAKIDIIKTKVKIIRKEAKKDIRKNNEINITDINNTINFDRLFE